MLALIGYVLRHFGQKVKRLKDLEIARDAGLKLLMAGLWVRQIIFKINTLQNGVREVSSYYSPCNFLY